MSENNTFLSPHTFITRSIPIRIHTLTATDGLSVIAEIPFQHNPVHSKCNILYRYIHNIDILAFNDDIVNSELITNPKSDLSQLCEQYHITLKSLPDKHAFIKAKVRCHYL